MENDIEIMDELTLDDDKDYVVSSIVNYNNITYVMIVETNNNKNIKFCEKYIANGDIHLRVLDDTNLINKLLPMFLKNGVEAMKNANLDDFN